MSKTLRRQLADAHAELRRASNERASVEHPLRIRLAEIERENDVLKNKLLALQLEHHALDVLCRFMRERIAAANQMTSVASGKRGVG